MAFKSKEGQRKYHREWYKKNRIKRRAEIKARERELRIWLNELKDTLFCLRCGEDHPACLQFHHRDSSSKDISISHAINNGWSRARITIEIQKCDVLCANCHFKLHYEEKRKV